MVEVIDECYGCVHDEPTIENALGYCSHCGRGAFEMAEYLEDLYMSRYERNEEK